MVQLTRLWFAAVALAIAALASVAHAQTSEADKASARVLAEEGGQALSKNDYKTAAEKFKKADQLYHAPTIIVGLARAYVGLGKYLEAKETYNRVIVEKLPPGASDKFVQAVEDAKREIVGLDERIAWGTINVIGPDPELPASLVATLDDVELKHASFGVKRPMNPGQHKLVVTAPGFKDVDRSFDVAPRADLKIDVKLERVATGAATVTQPNTTVTVAPNTTTNTSASTNATSAAGDSGGRGRGQRIAGFVCIGVGAAGLILGGITGGLALATNGELKKECPDGKCGADSQSKIDKYEALGAISTAGFIVGGVFAVTGLVVVLTAPKGEAKGMLRPSSVAVGARGIEAAWQF
jgi:hypothetical protein